MQYSNKAKDGGVTALKACEELAEQEIGKAAIHIELS